MVAPKMGWLAEVAQVVEHVTENHGVGGSTPPLGTAQGFPGAEVAEQADARVSKTLGGQPPCRFDPDLRH